MPELRHALAAALALALGFFPALAQEAGTPPAGEQPPAAGDEAPAEGPAPAPGTGFNAGEEVSEGPQVGQDYVVATEGDWEVRCVHTPDGFDPCRIYQLLKDGDGNAVAEFALVALPQGSEAAAGATVITPLETLLTAQLTLAVDAGKAKRYPFTWCSQIGCFARIGLVDAELQQMKKGVKATVTIVPMVAPDQQVNLTVSLKGFTAAFDAMKTRNDETEARANAAAAGQEQKPAAGGD